MTSVKLILAIAIGVAVIAIGTAIFFVFKGGIGGSSGELSENELSNGTSLMMGTKEMVKFSLEEEKHNLTIDAITNSSVNITLQSTIIKTRINVGQMRRFDLNGDDKEDVLVTLNNITNGKADLYLRKICFENWTCGNWTDCVNHNQTRVCTDSGNCGTESNKPEDIQECFPTCSSQNGILCSESETCEGNTTSASDGTCCFGTCGTKVFICGMDIDCLISAAQNCNVANFTGPSNFTNSTWTQTASYYYKIKGFKNEKCRLYEEIISVSGSFTSSGESALLAGNTQAQIDQWEEWINAGLLGKSGNCKFSTYDLDEYLTKVKEEDYKLTDADITDYECTGTLFG